MTIRPIAIVIAFSALGCGDRSHLTPSHGRAFRAAMHQQAVNPGAGAHGKDIKGLDSQEAAIVARTYRRNLAPKNAQSSQSEQPQMLMVAPSSKESGAYMPPPSVPERR